MREVSVRAVLVALALPSIACYLLLVQSAGPRVPDDGETNIVLCSFHTGLILVEIWLKNWVKLA